MKSRSDTKEGATLQRANNYPADEQTCEASRAILLSWPESQALARAYLRDLRAAEMTAWEMSGGDYLVSQSINPLIHKSTAPPPATWHLTPDT